MNPFSAQFFQKLVYQEGEDGPDAKPGPNRAQRRAMERGERTRARKARKRASR